LRFTLPKSEILRGYKSFTRVITTGKSSSTPPIRCYYIRSESDSTAIVAGFTVSRKIRKAVDRNKAKRLMRESYRMGKGLLAQELAEKKSQLEIVFMYVGSAEDLKKKKSFGAVNTSIWTIMSLISKEL
jgi:ribonuclease P protein component